MGVPEPSRDPYWLYNDSVASMTPAKRYVLAFALGDGVAVAAWFLVGSIHPRFWLMGPATVILGIVAGIAGGFSAGLVAPRRKVLISFLVGMVLAFVLLALYPIFGFHLGPRNPLLWYWPIWLIPGFVFGGFLSNKFLSKEPIHTGSAEK
jgi:hypothetical protein